MALPPFASARLGDAKRVQSEGANQHQSESESAEFLSLFFAVFHTLLTVFKECDEDATEASAQTHTKL